MERIRIDIGDISPVIKIGFAVFGLNLCGFGITSIKLKFFNIRR
jgi:hypothetical protein